MAAAWRAAAACDIRIAARDARFAMPEVKLGIIPGYGGTQRLTRLIGLGHALTLALGAREIDAPTAEQWGLVDVVTPAGEAESTALVMAQSIGAYAPLALANAKRAIRAGVDLDLAAGLAQEIDLGLGRLRHLARLRRRPPRLPGEAPPGVCGQLKRNLTPRPLSRGEEGGGAQASDWRAWHESRRDHLTGKPAVVYMK